MRCNRVTMFTGFSQGRHAIARFQQDRVYSHPGLLHLLPMATLYYPFHLCHGDTLHRLLKDHTVVHFRDFMALRLTPFMGTTAFTDRMGDYFPELLNRGQIVQGYDVSGSMGPEVKEWVDRDLSDRDWRLIFHEALSYNYRFQRGLFDESQFTETENKIPKISSILSKLTQPQWIDQPFGIERLQTLSQRTKSEEDVPKFEYGWAMVKTAAALAYTLLLCQQFGLSAGTDSLFHYRLLTHTCQRDHLHLAHSLVAL